MGKKAPDDCEYGEQLSRWKNEGGALDSCHKNVDEKGLRTSGVRTPRRAWHGRSVGPQVTPRDNEPEQKGRQISTGHHFQRLGSAMAPSEVSKRESN